MKNKSGIIFLIPLILIGVIIAGASYFWFNQNKVSETLPSPTPDSQTVIKDEINERDIFDSETYKFKFKIPEGFKVYESDSIFVTKENDASQTRWLKIEITNKFDQQRLLDLKIGESITDPSGTGIDFVTNRNENFDIGGKESLYFEKNQDWEAPGPIRIFLVPHYGNLYFKIWMTYSNDGSNNYTEGFDQILSTFEFTEAKPAENSDECFVAGCSGQLCVEESQSGMATTCEYLESYACTKLTKCERQNNGKCGWTENAEYSSCLEERS